MIDEESFLASARRGLEPDAQDAARVLHATRVAIASGAVSGAVATKLLAMKLIASALVVAGISGAIGYRLGWHEAEERARERPVAALAPSERAVPTAPSALALPIHVATPDAPIIATPVSSRSAADAGVRARGRAVQPRGPHLEPPEPVELGAHDAPTADAPSPSIDAEVRALERVQRALRDQAPTQALALLQQLDRDVPNGRLNEERSAASTVARCQLGRAEPLKLALEFSQRFPASVYFARVRQTCMDAAKSNGSQRP